MAEDAVVGLSIPGCQMTAVVRFGLIRLTSDNFRERGRSWTGRASERHH